MQDIPLTSFKYDEAHFPDYIVLYNAYIPNSRDKMAISGNPLWMYL